MRKPGRSLSRLKHQPVSVQHQPRVSSILLHPGRREPRLTLCCRPAVLGAACPGRAGRSGSRRVLSPAGPHRTVRARRTRVAVAAFSLCASRDLSGGHLKLKGGRATNPVLGLVSSGDAGSHLGPALVNAGAISGTICTGPTRELPQGLLPALMSDANLSTATRPSFLFVA